MMDYTPLRIDLQLEGLMAVPERHPPMLDAALLALKTQGVLIPEITADLLPLAAHTWEVNEGPRWHWHASAFNVRYCGPSTARFLFRNARPLDMLEHAADHNASRVYLDRGVTRTVKTRILLRQAESATAWCIGDARQLDHLLCQLTNLGALRHLGHGRVTSYVITEDEAARSNCWLRPIGQTDSRDPFTSERIAIQGQSQPPYWDRTTSIAYWPIQLI